MDSSAMSTNDCKHMKELGLISTVYKSLLLLSCVKDTSLIISLCTNSLVVSLWVLGGLAAEYPAPGTWARVQICPGCLRSENRIDSKCVTKRGVWVQFLSSPWWTPGSEKFCKSIRVGFPFGVLVLALTQAATLVPWG